MSTTTIDGLVDAHEPEENAAAAPLRHWWGNLPLLLLIVLSVAVAAGSLVLWRQNSDLKADRADDRAAARVASDFTTAVLSYNFRDLQSSVDDVQALSTRDWGRQYEDAWFQDQSQIVQATHARARVSVDDVMLGDQSDGVLPAIVRFNATIRSEVGVRRLQGAYLEVDLTKVDGHWRVDDMRYLATQDQSLDANDGGAGATATTTPPAGG
jgi:hypothetical protein